MTAMKMLRALLTAVLLIAAPGNATAAGQPPAAQDEFVPVDQLSDPQEELPAAPLVAGAYGVAWAAVLLYVWGLWRRLDRVERELADVSRRLGTGARQ